MCKKCFLQDVFASNLDVHRLELCMWRYDGLLTLLKHFFVLYVSRTKRFKKSFRTHRQHIYVCTKFIFYKYCEILKPLHLIQNPITVVLHIYIKNVPYFVNYIYIYVRIIYSYMKACPLNITHGSAGTTCLASPRYF